MLHELPEQQELQAGQRYWSLSYVRFQPAEIEQQLPRPEHFIDRVTDIAQPRPYPGQQFGERERLGQVVLRTEFQAVHLGGHVGQARQHQHRLLRSLTAQLGQDFPAVHVRHDQVKDHQVVVSCDSPAEPVAAGTCEIDCITSRRERPGYEIPDPRLVVDDEEPGRRQAHTRVVGGFRR